MRQGETAAIHTPRPAPATIAHRAAAARLVPLCLLLLVTGCADCGSRGAWRVAARLSAPADAELFSFADVTRETVVRSWRLTDAGPAGAWRVDPADAMLRRDRGGVWLRAAGPELEAASLTAEVDLAAAEVSLIELRLRNPSRAASDLLWAGAGQEFSGDRRLARVEAERGGGQGPIRVVRFRVADHPRWRGSVRRLRLRPAVGSRRDFAVESLRAIRVATDEELEAAAARRAWKVDLDATIREARVAFAGRPWTAALTVPDGSSELRFVPGLPALGDAGTRIAVSAVADGGERPLLRADFSPAAGHRGGWQEPVSLPLDELAGRDVELRFEVVGAAPAGGFVAWGNPHLAARGGRAPPPNVVLICIDTLRADHLSAYGYERRTSPRIDRWAAERAVLFEQAVAPSPWTLPSLISIFTGLDAIRHGANYHLQARPGLDMLAELLAARGYETVAWTGGAYLGPGHGLHQGFEAFTYHRGAKERELADNTDRAVAWLGSRRDRPFFLLFHTYEVHSPYLERQPFYDDFAERSGRPRIPAEWVGPRRRPRLPEDGYRVSRELTMSPDRGESWQPVPSELAAGVVDRYDAGIRYTDERIGRLLDALDDSGLAAETVVILTSDHGEGLGEHGLSGHSYLYDFNLLVPLIVAAPTAGWPAGRRVRRQVRSVDLAPTVLDLLDIDAGGPMDGESLSPLALGLPGAGDRLAWSYAAISNRGVSLRLPRLKYVFNNSAPRPLFASERLVDLERDPGETADVAAERAADAERFRELVSRRLAGEAVAVWFHLQGAPAREFIVELAGADIADPSRLKAVELPGDGITYAGSPPERAVVTLPPGGAALLYAEARADARVRLAVDPASPGAAERRWALRLDEVASQPWSAGPVNGRWTEGAEPTGPAGPRLSVFVSHGLGSAATPADANAELEEQLRALGYLQ